MGCFDSSSSSESWPSNFAFEETLCGLGLGLWLEMFASGRVLLDLPKDIEMGFDMVVLLYKDRSRAAMALQTVA